jgi:protoporphyrinogen oxidase
MGIVTAKDRITHSSVVTVPYAYPVYTADTRDAREHLLSSLRGLDILCAGRFGEWRYINSDDAIMSGRHRAEEILGKARQ